MAAAERLPLLKEAERVPVHAPGKARLLRIFIPVALFAAAVLVFTSTPATQISSASTELHESPATGVIFEEELFGDEVDGSTLAPAHVTTSECTGDTSKAVVQGVDVVAYRSLAVGLAVGHHAVNGSKEFSSVYGRYLFYFSSLKNKLEFESNPARYVPAFGGFCSYGISHEIIWNENNLGPQSNPKFWLIYDDQLYLFRSETPFSKFQAQPEHYIKHGQAMWNEWFGEDTDAAFSPFNTACFCSVATCSDG